MKDFLFRETYVEEWWYNTRGASILFIDTKKEHKVKMIDEIETGVSRDNEGTIDTETYLKLIRRSVCLSCTPTRTQLTYFGTRRKS